MTSGEGSGSAGESPLVGGPSAGGSSGVSPTKSVPVKRSGKTKVQLWNEVKLKCEFDASFLVIGVL